MAFKTKSLATLLSAMLMLILACRVVAEDFPGAAPMAAGHPNLPNGYEMLALFKCGAVQDKVEKRGVRIALSRGAQRPLDGVAGTITGEAFDGERVEFEISGLDAHRDYVLGYTWWDRDGQGRKEAVEFGRGTPIVWSNVMPPTLPLAFHGDQPTYARIQLPVPMDAAKTGRLSVAFTKAAGPDAVVNEVWLLRKISDQPRKRIVIVTGDDWKGHYWRATGPELAAILREDARLEVSIVESPAIFASPSIDLYDATIIHFKDYANRLPLGDDVRQGIEKFVGSGHGLVLAHFACGAFQEWGRYVDIVGRVWDPQRRGHDPYGPFHVRIPDRGHPITANMREFDTSDELYTCLVGEPAIRVLFSATSVIDRLEYPMGFVIANNSDRVFHCTLGHDVAALRSPGARELYRRATAWAVGLPSVAPAAE